MFILFLSILLTTSNNAFCFNPVAILAGAGSLTKSAMGVATGDFSSAKTAFDTVDGAVSSGIETGLLLEELGNPNPFKESDATAEYIQKLTERAQDIGYTKDQVENLFGEDIKQSRSVADRIRQLRTSIQLMKKVYSLTSAIGGKKVAEVNSTEAALYAQRNFDMNQKIYNELVRQRLEKKEQNLNEQGALRKDIKQSVSQYKDHGISLINGIASTFTSPSPLIQKAKEIAIDIKHQFVDKLVVLFFVGSLSWLLFKLAPVSEYKFLFTKLLLYVLITALYPQLLDSAIDICFAAAKISFSKIETLSEDQTAHVQSNFKRSMINDSNAKADLDRDALIKSLMITKPSDLIYADKKDKDFFGIREKLGEYTEWFNKSVTIPFFKHLFDILIASIIALSPMLIFLAIFVGMRELGLLVFVTLFAICLVGIVWNTLGYFAGIMLADTESVVAQMDAFLITLTQILLSLFVVHKTGIASTFGLLSSPLGHGVSMLKSFYNNTHHAEKKNQMKMASFATAPMDHMDFDEKHAMVNEKVRDWTNQANVYKERGDLKRANTSLDIADKWKKWNFRDAHLQEKKTHKSKDDIQAHYDIGHIHKFDEQEKKAFVEDKVKEWSEHANILRSRGDDTRAVKSENVAEKWRNMDFVNARHAEKQMYRSSREIDAFSNSKIINHMNPAEKAKLVKDKVEYWNQSADVYSYQNDNDAALLRREIASTWSRGDITAAQLKEQEVYKKPYYENKVRIEKEKAEKNKINFGAETHE